MPGSMSLDAVPGLGSRPKEGLECRLSFLSMKCQWRMVLRQSQTSGARIAAGTGAHGFKRDWRLLVINA